MCAARMAIRSSAPAPAPAPAPGSALLMPLGQANQHRCHPVEELLGGLVLVLGDKP